MRVKILFILLTIIAFASAPVFAGRVGGPDSPLRFDAASHDFGTIRESDGKVSHTFRFRNVSRKPVVIIAVQTSCGCTVPEFSKRPVMPGDEGEITLTYNPADRPGPFTRDAEVYAADRHVVATLRVEGSVEPRPRSVEELYPFDLGGGVRASAVFVPFGYVSHGEPKQSYIDIVNTSPRAVGFAVRAVERSGLLTIAAPSRLEAGGKGEIRLEYLAPSGCGLNMTADDAAEIAVDGSVSAQRLTANAIVVEKYAPAAKFPAPQAQLNKNIANFGTVKHSSDVRAVPLTIANNGGDALLVYGVEFSGEGAEAVSATLAAGLTVDGGESEEFELLLTPSLADYGFMTVRMRIFTNDPVRPMRQVRVTAAVEE